MASAFPRGGDGSSTGVKRASAEAPSSSNDLFGSKRTKRIEVAPVKLSDKQKKLAKRAGGDKAKAGAGTGSLARAGLGQTNTSGGDHSVTKIEQLTFSKYQAGCLALGFVLNVTSSHAIISLPGGATGTVAYGEISDYCNRLCQAGRSNVGGKGQKEYGSDGKAKGSPLIRDLLPVNSPVKCYVLGVAEDKKSAKIKKTLELSCRLSLVNRGLALRHLLTGTTVAATVTSVADDGYIMSAGIPDVTFYLPENKVPSSAGRLTLGATRDCVVDVVKEASRAVILRAQDKSVRDAVAFGTALTFNNLLPGNLVMVAVDRVIQNGIIVSFLGLFKGSIDMYNLPRPMTSAEMARDLRPGTTLHARIVYCDHANKVLRLSLRPHVVERDAGMLQLPKLGCLVSGLEVASSNRKVGVFLRPSADDDDSDAEASKFDDGEAKTNLKMSRKQQALNNAGHAKKIGVLIHRSSLAPLHAAAAVEGKKKPVETAVDGDALEKTFKQGTAVPTARVVGHHLVEGWALATTMPSQLVTDDSIIMHSDNLSVGQLVQGTITDVQDFGVTVTLAGGRVRAVCPAMHLGDSLMSAAAMRLKYRKNHKLWFRVWEKNGSAVVLSAKKAIVGPTSAKDDDGEAVTPVLPAGVLTSYSGAEVGASVLGVVSRIASSGLRVHFCNRVQGILNIAILMRQGVTNPEDSFRMGQVIKCAVLYVDHKGSTLVKSGKEKNKTKMLLGLDLSAAQTAELAKEVKAQLEGTGSGAAQGPGADADADDDDDDEGAYERVDGTVMRVNEDEDGDLQSVSLRLDDGRVGLLEMSQLCDFASEATFVAEDLELKEGARVVGLLVLSYASKGTGTVKVSYKPLLLGAAMGALANGGARAAIPGSLSDMAVGQLVCGYIQRVEHFGVFVRFRNNVSALVPRAGISDDKATAAGDLSPLFCEGDSICATVTAIDQERGRAVLSLRKSVVPPVSGFLNYFTSSALQRLGSTPESDTFESLPATMQGQLLAQSERAARAAADDDADASFPAAAELVEATVEHVPESGAYAVISLPAPVKGKGKKGAKTSKAKAPEKDLAILSLSDWSYPYVGTSKPAGLVIGETVSVRLLFDPSEDAEDDDDDDDSWVEMNADAEGDAAADKGGDGDEEEDDDEVSEDGSDWSVEEDGLEWAGKLLVYGTADSGKPISRKPKELKEPAAVPGPGEKLALAPAQQGELYALSSLKPGCTRSWRVVSVSATELRCAPDVPEGSSVVVSASCHVSCGSDDPAAYDRLEEISQALDAKGSKIKVAATALPKFHPFASLKEGMLVVGRVLQTRAPGAKGTAPRCFISLVQTPSDRSARGRRMVQWQGQNAVKPHVVYKGAVVKVGATTCLVALSPYVTASLSFMDVSDDMDTVARFRRTCFVGQPIAVVCRRVTRLDGGDDEHQQQKFRLDVTRAPLEAAWEVDHTAVTDCQKVDLLRTCAPSPAAGKVAMGIVSSISSKGCFVRLGGELTGRVLLKDLSDDFVEKPEDDDRFRRGALVCVRVLSVDDEARTAKLSLKQSAVTGEFRQQKELDALADKVGKVVTGTVSSVAEFGVFVDLQGTSLRGLARRHDAQSRTHIEAERALTVDFEAGSVVQAKVLSITGDRVSLGLKSSFFKSDGSGSDDSDDSDSDDDSDEASGSDDDDDDDDSDEEQSDSDDDSDEEDTGLAMIVEDSDDESVEAMIAKANLAHGMNDDDDDDDDDDDESVDMEGVLEPLSDEGSDDDVEAMIAKANLANGLDDGSGSDDEEDEDEGDMDVDVDGEEESDDDDDGDGGGLLGGGGARKGKGTGGLTWDDFAMPAAPTSSSSGKAGAADSDSDSDSDEESEEDEEEGGKKSRRGKDAHVKEKETRTKERALVEGSEVPTTTKSFERLLVGSPNGSFMWIQYMAMHMGNADVERARAVARRALSTIGFREEDEKYNVWAAWVTLEYKFGDMASLDRVFKQACQESKGKKLHLLLADVYQGSGDPVGATAVFDKALKNKKLKSSKQVWAAYQRFYIKAGDVAKAKELLRRSMQSLSRHKHVWVMQQYAFAEFELGDPERARNLFDDLLAASPKRMDIWNVYVDREVKGGHVQQARALFERMTTLKMSTKNIRALFKKYLLFEKKHGTDETTAAVLERAKDYRDSLM